MTMSENLEPITDAQRDEFSRDELNAIAKSEGVENAEQLRTKADVVAAINERRAAAGGGGGAVGTTSTGSTGAVGSALSPDAPTTNQPRDAGAPGGSNPPRDERDPAAVLNTTVVVQTRPTAESVFGGEQQAPGALAFDTSAFQPKGDEPPVYGDARTRTLVGPNGNRLDGGGTVNRSDDNRDKGNE